MNDSATPPGKYLNTLAFRATPQLVGDARIFLRRFEKDTYKLWEDFDRDCQKRYGNDSAQAPYSIATTVLAMITGGYVHLSKDYRNPFLVSRQPIDPTLLQKVFTLTYHLALGAAVAVIDLNAPPELAKRIAATPEVGYQLADHLAPTDRAQPSLPNWVYQTIAWDLALRLSKPVWKVDGHEIRLRPDTGGGLVALDDPWQNEQGGRYALNRTDLRLKTVPNLQSPILLLDSRVTRISASLIFSRTALVVQPGEGSPLLEVELNGRGGARTINRLALEALGRLKMDYSILRTIADRSQREQQLLADAKANKEPARFSREHPGQVWPILPKNFSFPIGTGVGMHHLRLLHEHFMTVFGDAQPLSMREVTMDLPHRPNDPERVDKEELERRKAEREARKQAGQTGKPAPLRPRGDAFPAPDSVAASVEDAGFKKLRITCLWYRDETRLRMLGALCRAYGLAHEGLDPADGVEFELHGPRITAVFHHAPDFLQPGPPAGRGTALERIGGLHEATTLVAAWCETERPRRTEPAAEGETDVATELDDLDAKYQTKVILAGLRVPNQYLLGRNERGVIKPKEKDHPADMALLDLYRSAGIIDERIANALEPEKNGMRVDKIAHVGIHVRQQNRRKGEAGEPKVVITATALVPPAAEGGVWAMLGWSSTRPEWQPYSRAQTDFHATAYPTGGTKRTYRQRWDEAADAVEEALNELAGELDEVAFAITVDEQAARRMWDGLQNVRQGTDPGQRASKHWLPGAGLPAVQRPMAIIRVNIDDEQVPQPVSTTRINKTSGKQSDGDTARTLYELATDFDSPVWIFCNVPRAFDGAGGRLGSQHTRWDAERSVFAEKKEDRRKGEMPQNWYAMTATEIFPIGCADHATARALAITTAKLCHQTIGWTDRARYPVPLHAARQMDLDHPQYRRTAPPEETITNEPGADDQPPTASQDDDAS